MSATRRVPSARLIDPIGRSLRVPDPEISMRTASSNPLSRAAFRHSRVSPTEGPASIAEVVAS